MVATLTIIGQSEADTPKARISAENGQPEVYHNGIWYPICGHWFWDTQYGTNLFCTELNGEPSTGTITRRIRYDSRQRQELSSQGIMIGKCLKSDTSLFGCTGGHNMKLHYRGQCAAGKRSGIIIDCSPKTEVCPPRVNAKQQPCYAIRDKNECLTSIDSRKDWKARVSGALLVPNAPMATSVNQKNS